MYGDEKGPATEETNKHKPEPPVTCKGLELMKVTEPPVTCKGLELMKVT